jgi:tetratricopeptide (TPR) repeat protein/tRNA A-37 threonylcarbamoyl transferase component Bud32
MSGLEGLLAGRLLGDRYRIEEVIGRGGMGAVYRATDERLGRQVAVKVITVSGGADPDARDRLRARFYREARAAAALPHHPNVVPVYDYGSDPTIHLDFIVMELLRGQDLATRLARSGPPPLATGIRILYEAARGVAIGHRSGLIHRDVKPGNIFLAEADQGEVQVRVVDFGIAKLADDEDTLGQLTQDGRVPHSPAFASPEQLRGLGKLTPASDVFSLGAVGFTLLTGQRPYSEADRNRMALGLSVPAPSLRASNQAIPSAVEAVVQRALSFDAEDRYQSAAEMAREIAEAMRSLGEAPLEPYAAGGLREGAPAAAGAAAAGYEAGDDRTRAIPDEDDRTLLAPPPASRAPAPGPQAPASRAFPRREPRRRGVGGVIVWLLVLLVLAAAAYAILNEQSEPRLPRATSPEPAESIPPPPDSVPTIVPETPVASTDSVAGDGQPELQAYVLNAEGRRLFRLEQYAEAAENLRRATELAPGSADYAYDYGHTLMRMGRTADAAEQFERAISLSPTRTAAHYNLGVARLSLGDTTAAWLSLQRARELAETPAERAAILREIRAIQAARTAAPRPPTDAPADTSSDTTASAPVGTARSDTAVARPVRGALGSRAFR